MRSRHHATERWHFLCLERKGMWKDIKGYEGLYQVSDEGYVRRILSDGKYRTLKNRDGLYYTVSLSAKCVKKSHAVHRLVAEMFLPKPEGTTEVNHKDGDKHNNRVENLEWVTQKQNCRHMIETLNKNPFGKAPKKVKCIDPLTEDVIEEFKSITDASKWIGKMSARASIIHVCQGYQPTAYGYRWEYAD